MSETNRPITKEESFELKQDARDSRLTIRKSHEETLYRQFRAEGLTQCKEEMKLFADCSRQEGFWVVFNCRQQNKNSK